MWISLSTQQTYLGKLENILIKDYINYVVSWWPWKYYIHFVLYSDDLSETASVQKTPKTPTSPSSTTTTGAHGSDKDAIVPDRHESTPDMGSADASDNDIIVANCYEPTGIIGVNIYLFENK